jgi:hypothetical protein
MQPTSTARGETIVVRCPQVVRVVVPLLGLAGLAYLAVGLVHGRFPVQDMRLVSLAAALVVAAVLILFISRSRLEIDAEEIRQYRGANLVRRAPVRAIRAIALGLQKKTLRFDGGEEFNLHDGFENVALAVAFFQAILDARASSAAPSPPPAGVAAAAAAPPAVDLEDAGGALPVAAPAGNRVTLPLQYVAFPAQCCRCGRAAGTTCQVSMSRSIWLLFTTVSTIATVYVPACKWCKTKRSVAGVLSLLLLLLTIVAGLIAFLVIGIDRGGPGITLAALGVFLVLMWILGRSLDGILDRHFVGVRAVSMSKNVQTITLGFRDAAVAAAVAELTERRRARQVAGARQVLGEAR